jgi:hypothetical protein
VKAREYRAKRDTLLAYQTGAFAGLAFNGKLKAFAHYADSDGQPVSNAQAIGFFHRLKARGVPVKIERVDRAANQ